jgi:membrane protease YdiL (CAAX protease family)
MEKTLVPSRWRLVFSVGAFLILSAASLAVVAPLVSTAPPLWKDLFTGLAAGGCVYALTVIFVRMDRIGLRQVGAVVDRRSFLRFLFGSGLGISTVAVWALLSEGAGHVRWVRQPHVTAPDILLVFIAYVALAGREELAFRGYPLRRLDERFGRIVAAVTIAVLFALEHRLGGMSWTDALIGAGTGSIVFSLAALVTRGLAVPVGIHAAWNFGQWALGLRGSAGIWVAAGPKDHVAYLIGMIIYIIVMTGVAVGLLWWEHPRKPGRPPNSR